MKLFFKVRLTAIVFALINILIFLNFYKNRKDNISLSDYIDKEKFFTNLNVELIINPHHNVFYMGGDTNPLLYHKYISEILNNGGDTDLALNTLKDMYPNLNWDILNNPSTEGVALLLPYETSTGIYYAPEDIFTEGEGFGQVLILEKSSGSVSVDGDKLFISFNTLAHEYLHSVMFNPIFNFTNRSKLNKLVDLYDLGIFKDINENLACIFEIYAGCRYYKLPIDQILRTNKYCTFNIISKGFWRIVYNYIKVNNFSSFSDILGIFKFAGGLLRSPYLSKDEIMMLYPIFMKLFEKEFDLIYSNLIEYMTKYLFTDDKLNFLEKNLKTELNSIDIRIKFGS